MLSYARGPEADIWNKTIDEVFRETARRFPDRDAVVVRHQAIRLTWSELDEQVDRTAAGLRVIGPARPATVPECGRLTAWNGCCCNSAARERV